MKKGFTLIELIGAIVILSIIALVTYPTLKSAFNSSKDNLSEEQIASLEEVARIWATKNSDELSEDEVRYVTIEELKKSGLVENKEILSVDNEEELKGCIKIYYENNKYNYKYDIYTDEARCH